MSLPLTFVAFAAFFAGCSATGAIVLLRLERPDAAVVSISLPRLVVTVAGGDGSRAGAALALAAPLRLGGIVAANCVFLFLRDVVVEEDI